MQQNLKDIAIRKSANIIKKYIINTDPTLKTIMDDVKNESRIPEIKRQELSAELEKFNNGGSVELQGNLQSVYNKLRVYQNLKDSFKKKVAQIKTAQSLVLQIKNPKEFNGNNANRPQIKSDNNIYLPFSNGSNYQNLNFNIQPQANAFNPQIIKYDINPQTTKHDINTQTNEFSLQDIIYTSLIDKNFMHSEPNSVAFWSRCDFNNNDLQNLQQHNFWGPSFTQNIWGDNRNAALTRRPPLRGDQTSDTIAHSLNRHTLRDVWKFNIDNGTVLKGINNVPVFNEMSRLLAERASGEVIFISGDKNPATNRYGDTWENIEKPTLMKNPDVTMIIEIDVKNPNKIKTITFPHGITQEIKAKYPIFANLKDEIKKIDYISKTVQYKNRTKYSLDDPLNQIDPSKPLKRGKSPKKPLQLRNAQQANNQKMTRTKSLGSFDL